MKRRILLYTALTLAGCPAVAAPDASSPPRLDINAVPHLDTPAPPPPVVAPEPPPADPSVISTSEAPNYPLVTCTTSDAPACGAVLQIASDTRDQLGALLQLGKTWRFPVHIHVLTVDDPLTAKINREAAAVFAQGPIMKIEAVLPDGDPHAREFVQRQFVTALLWEKFFANTQAFDKHTKLDVVPLWLVEGLREWLNEDPEHNREEIVRRAVQNQTAPSLAEIIAWGQLADDKLLGLWQRAFSYYLVDSLVHETAQREGFQQWLAGYAGPNPSAAQYLFPSEANWQRELAAATVRSQDIVFSWDESKQALESAETLTVAAGKDGKVQTWTLDTLARLPRNKVVVEALQEKILVLTGLELRVHPSWRPILELYRFGLNAVINDPNQVDAKSILLEAQQKRLAEIQHHQKLLDYVNWFEVTKDIAGDSTHFSSYFSTAEEMKRIEADPAHPNPIRADLLQIESQL